VARIGGRWGPAEVLVCGKSQKQVKKLIAGPGVYIMRRVHRSLQRDHRGRARRATEFKWDSLPKPREIYESSTRT